MLLHEGFRWILNNIEGAYNCTLPYWQYQVKNETWIISWKNVMDIFILQFLQILLYSFCSQYKFQKH